MACGVYKQGFVKSQEGVPLALSVSTAHVHMSNCPAEKKLESTVFMCAALFTRMQYEALYRRRPLQCHSIQIRKLILILRHHIRNKMMKIEILVVNFSEMWIFRLQQQLTYINLSGHKMLGVSSTLLILVSTYIYIYTRSLEAQICRPACQLPFPFTLFWSQNRSSSRNPVF